MFYFILEEGQIFSSIQVRNKDMVLIWDGRPEHVAHVYVQLHDVKGNFFLKKIGLKSFSM